MASLNDDIGRLIPHLRRFARALVRGHGIQAADDIVQETVVLAMRSEGLARGASLTTWCFGTLLRVHRLRQKHVLWERQGGSQGVGFEHDAAFGQGAAPLAVLSKDIARLDALPLPNREVLLLTVMAGMTYARVAEVLSLPPETVIERLSEARDMLAKSELAGSMTGAPQGSAKSLHRFGGGTAPSAADHIVAAAPQGPSAKRRSVPYLRLVK